MANRAVAKLNHLHIAPRKVRLIASTLKGLTVSDAQAQLMFRPQRAAKPVFKLLKSAISNARNLKLDEQKLVIRDIRVNEGSRLKRMMPRAMGRGTLIQKKMSHVIIVLEESDKARKPVYVIPEVKKIKKETKKPAKKIVADNDSAEEATASAEVQDEVKKPRQRDERDRAKKGFGGFTKRLFNRKSGG